MIIEERVERIKDKYVSAFSEFCLYLLGYFGILLSKTPMDDNPHTLERTKVFVHIPPIGKYRRKIFSRNDIFVQTRQTFFDG